MNVSEEGSPGPIPIPRAGKEVNHHNRPTGPVPKEES